MHYFSNVLTEQNYQNTKKVEEYNNDTNKRFKLSKNIKFQEYLSSLKISFEIFLLNLNSQLTEENINNILVSILFHFTIYKNELYYFSYEDKVIQKINNELEFFQYFNSKIFYLNNDILTNFKTLFIDILKNKINLLHLFQPSFISAETNELICIKTNREIIKDIQYLDILIPYFITYGLNNYFDRRKFLTLNDTVLLNTYTVLTEDLFKNIFTPYEYEKNNTLFFRLFSKKDLFKKVSLPSKRPLYFKIENKLFEIKIENKNFSYEPADKTMSSDIYFNFEYLLSSKYFDKILEYLCAKSITTLKSILNLCYEINFKFNSPKAYIIKVNKENKFNLPYYLSTLCHQNIIIADTDELLNLFENSTAFLLNNSIFLQSPIVINDNLKLSELKAQKLTNILKGAKIKVNSSIQKTICYKNNVPFIFIDYGDSDFRNLILALKDNNITITQIDLTNIDFNNYTKCFPKFYPYYI